MADFIGDAFEQITGDLNSISNERARLENLLDDLRALPVSGPLEAWMAKVGLRGEDAGIVNIFDAEGFETLAAALADTSTALPINVAQGLATAFMRSGSMDWTSDELKRNEHLRNNFYSLHGTPSDALNNIGCSVRRLDIIAKGDAATGADLLAFVEFVRFYPQPNAALDWALEQTTKHFGDFDAYKAAALSHMLIADAPGDLSERADHLTTAMKMISGELGLIQAEEPQQLVGLFRMIGHLDRPMRNFPYADLAADQRATLLGAIEAACVNSVHYAPSAVAEAVRVVPLGDRVSAQLMVAAVAVELAWANPSMIETPSYIDNLAIAIGADDANPIARIEISDDGELIETPARTLKADDGLAQRAFSRIRALSTEDRQALKPRSSDLAIGSVSNVLDPTNAINWEHRDEAGTATVEFALGAAKHFEARHETYSLLPAMAVEASTARGDLMTAMKAMRYAYSKLLDYGPESITRLPQVSEIIDLAASQGPSVLTDTAFELHGLSTMADETRRVYDVIPDIDHVYERVATCAIETKDSEAVAMTRRFARESKSHNAQVYAAALEFALGNFEEAGRHMVVASKRSGLPTSELVADKRSTRSGAAVNIEGSPWTRMAQIRHPTENRTLLDDFRTFCKGVENALTPAAELSQSPENGRQTDLRPNPRDFSPRL